ncbi:MAG TPA: hypothetical protein DCS21_08210 [Gammaproteobacteria bacterium]|nr:hypothetical protein [Gammaproteobacteria bacterium]
MYKWIKLTIDLLFLLISGTILAYLYLLNASLPIGDHKKIHSAKPLIVQVKQDTSLQKPAMIATSPLVNFSFLMEIDHD